MNVERIATIALDKDTAEKYCYLLVQEQLGQTAKDVKYLGGGSFGRAFRVGLDDRQIVIKFLIAKDMLQKEVYDLGLLAENCDIKFPKVLFARQADSIIGVDCYGMENIQGKSVITTLKMFFMSKRKRLEFADKVTTALHQIHCKTNDKFGDTISPDCLTWLEYYRPFAKEVFDKAQELYKDKMLSEKIITTMRMAWEKFDIIFSQEVKDACLIHGDLNIANIMVDKNCNITGFIDPLNSTYADREYDLFQLDNLMGKRFYLRKTYLDKYGASQNCDIKCAFYALWNEVYCYIKAGTLVGFIMNPLVKNMRKMIKRL